jgi:hypothetical protein
MHSLLLNILGVISSCWAVETFQPKLKIMEITIFTTIFTFQLGFGIAANVPQLKEVGQ